MIRVFIHPQPAVGTSKVHLLLFALVVLLCRQVNATDISFTHDALSRPIEKRVAGVRTKGWLWSDRLHIAAELDSTNAVTAQFIYASGANVPSHVTKGTNLFRLITDSRGSVRLVVNTRSGEIVQRLDYDEWGQVTRDTNPGFQPFGFAGGLYDPDVGLVRFGARNYDGRTKRWTAKDPIQFEGGSANLYAYVSSDPVNQVDPFGTDIILTVEGYDQPIDLQSAQRPFRAPVNGENGQVSATQIPEIIITKQQDQSTAFLVNHSLNGDPFNATISYRTPDGREYMRVDLEGVEVTSHTGSGSMESFSFEFKKVTTKVNNGGEAKQKVCKPKRGGLSKKPASPRSFRP